MNSATQEPQKNQLNRTAAEPPTDTSSCSLGDSSHLAQARAALHGQSAFPTSPRPFELTEFDSPVHNVETGKRVGMAELALPESDQVDLRVELGQSLLNIEHVMDLRKGCVVQLDQAVNQPVILFANDQQIAQGELVVVNGRFGVRITQLRNDLSACQESVDPMAESVQP